ncbi:MAG: hypothetical protein FJ150_02595 [Euryarchaeota archaeon]|nr:hypothetical protein [Euryarchaeota archaeon]
MDNKDKFNLSLIALVLIILAFFVGYYANPLVSGNITKLGWDNSTIQSDGNTELQSTGDGGSPGGGDQPPDDNPERIDCPRCEGGTYERVVLTRCTVCDGRGWNFDPLNTCMACNGQRQIVQSETVVCGLCGADGYLDPGDPGYSG